MSTALLFFASAFFAMEGPAHGQDAITLEIVRHGMEGQGSPSLILHPQVDLFADLTLACGPLQSALSGDLDAGTPTKLELKLPTGVHACSGELNITLTDGSGGLMPLGFEVEQLPPLGITVDMTSLQPNSMNIRLDRPAGDATVRAIALDGRELAQGTALSSGTQAGQPIAIEWPMPTEEVLRLEVRAEDSHGFWGALSLYPWYYEIPHEDVVFDTAMATIATAETGKLQAAMVEIEKIRTKYGPHATVNLYVGGYTDRVGSSEANKALSARRAEAIGAWFQSAGFTAPIYHQGFGERGLAVHTPDEVDEPRNRRAVYIVAAEPPPLGDQLPGQAWTLLR